MIYEKMAQLAHGERDSFYRKINLACLVQVTDEPVELSGSIGNKETPAQPPARA